MKTLKIADEASFKLMLCMERKRSERTAADFLLMLLDVEHLAVRRQVEAAEDICSALGSVVRDTDFTGWYRYNSTIGVIFTAFNGTSRDKVKVAISQRVAVSLEKTLRPDQLNKLKLSFYFFPQDEQNEAEARKVLYPQYEANELSTKMFAAVKRMTDIVGSLSALVLLSPVFLLIAIGTKMSSPGPIFYRQKRLGKWGKEFTFLKFRSMYTGNNPAIHREYTQNLIRGKADEGSPVFKIQNDPRVTKFGRLLRVTSLDELPQFFNVLVGTMSLVGPRPPIPYEFECYEPWHRRRVLEIKPGVTGIWQVQGRSRTTFEEMVRMDLQYVRDRSFLLDLKILLKTPLSVFSRDGAF